MSEPNTNHKFKSDFSLQAPGKVFFLGEYACLVGGPALLKTIDPKFSLRCSLSGDGKTHLPSIVPASPAGVYLLQNSKTLNSISIGFTDPYIEKYKMPIGVGSSSAQFLLSVQAVDEILGRKTSIEEILSIYWKIIGDSQGLKPSGVDLVAQYFGNAVQFIQLAEGKLAQHRKLTAALSADHDFYLVFTGTKLKTHDHLQALKARGFSSEFEKMLIQLNQLTESGLLAYDKGDATMFAEVMNRYQSTLDDNKIGDLAFREMISVLRSIDGVLGAKGSGAQGGDCILTLVEKKKAETFIKKASAHFSFVIRI